MRVEVVAHRPVIVWRSISDSCIASRRRSSIRWRRRSASSTGASSSIGNGGVSDVGEVLGLGDRQLDLAGAQLRVLLALLAADDLAGRADHVLGAQLLRERMRLRRVLGVEDELEDARAVAQVDEHEAAVVAAAVDPAGHADAARRPARRRARPPRRRGRGSARGGLIGRRDVVHHGVASPPRAARRIPCPSAPYLRRRGWQRTGRLRDPPA